MKNNTSKYDLTILVPAYNEEDNISRLENSFDAFLPVSKLSACVLFIDDGSTDNTLAKLKDLCSRHEDFYYLSLKKNSGLSAAMKAGIDFTKSKYVGYIDADLQTAPEDFNLLIPHLDNHELVMGIRTNRKDSTFKKIQSRIANGFRRMMTHDGVSDTGCPLKIMHTEYAARIPFFTGMHRFLPALIQLQHGRVKQIPVRHFPRQAGVSKYHLFNRLIQPFGDCFALRWMAKRYINYQPGDTDLDNA
ncbi:MAG: glycosyltransferase family 2 protein [Prevotella sp.]|nr:glycosyltransferase family 2 protein [Bacteroides sp.]MCM1366465.1 glycosyltransferase family 2 protein [Prevotella sp.]MCM1437055.1 glycosyltransferase family 2 protein [Prevotella sp.]